MDVVERERERWGGAGGVVKAERDTPCWIHYPRAVHSRPEAVKGQGKTGEGRAEQVHGRGHGRVG